MAPAPTSSKGAAKGSKKAVESINAKLQLVMKSGKVALGLKTVTKSLRHNKAKMVIISSAYKSRRRVCTPCCQFHSSAETSCFTAPCALLLSPSTLS